MNNILSFYFLKFFKKCRRLLIVGKCLIMLVFFPVFLTACASYGEYKTKNTLDDLHLKGQGPDYQVDFTLPADMLFEQDTFTVSPEGYTMRFSPYPDDPTHYLEISYTRSGQPLGATWRAIQAQFSANMCQKTTINRQEFSETQLSYTASLAKCKKVLEPFYVTENSRVTEDGTYSIKYYTQIARTTRHERAEMTIVVAGAHLVPYQVD
jgi:hypothetical protein